MGSMGMPRPSSMTSQPPSAQQGHVDARAVPGHGLVDRVVDDLVHQVVQAADAGRADVHAGTLADVLEAFERRDGTGVVRVGRCCQNATLPLRRCDRRTTDGSSAYSDPAPTKAQVSGPNRHGDRQVYQGAVTGSERPALDRSDAASWHADRVTALAQGRTDPDVDGRDLVGPERLGQPRPAAAAPGSAAGSPRPGRARPRRVARAAATPAGTCAASCRPTTTGPVVEHRPDGLGAGARRGSAAAGPGPAARGLGGSSPSPGQRLPGHGRPTPPVPGAGATVPACDRRARGRATRPGGSAPAVVSTVWPVGQVRQERLAAPGVELGEHVVEQQHRRDARRLVHHRWVARRRAQASDRCSPWDAWVRAGRPPMRSSTSSRWGPTVDTPAAHVVGPGGGQGGGQTLARATAPRTGPTPPPRARATRRVGQDQLRR